uniref:Pro-corazonin n=2 Tax=Nephila sp. SGP-2016 TaxID=1905176 RepID=A0A4Q8K9H6_9ARAC
MKSATAISLLVVLQLVLSTTGQTFQYSQGWTNGRKRSYEVEKELQQYPRTFSAIQSKDFDDEQLETTPQDMSFRKKIIQLLRLEQDDMQQNL